MRRGATIGAPGQKWSLTSRRPCCMCAKPTTTCKPRSSPSSQHLNGGRATPIAKNASIAASINAGCERYTSSIGAKHELHTERLHFVYYERRRSRRVSRTQAQKSLCWHVPHVGITRRPRPKASHLCCSPPIGRSSSTIPHLQVTSPLLAQIPVEQSEADYLAYDIMGWFTYRAMRDAAPNAGVRYLYRWPILVWGLRGWLRDDLLEQSSPWREEAIDVLRQASPKFLPIALANITDLRTDTRPTARRRGNLALSRRRILYGANLS